MSKQKSSKEIDNWRTKDADEFYEKLGNINDEELEYEVKKAQQKPAGRRHGSQVVQTMTKDEEKLKKFLDCTDSKKARTILESLDDWILAGLVIWKEVNKAQKNWISKKNKDFIYALKFRI